MAESKETAPAFPLYVKDYLTAESVLLMSWAQRGVYVWLLCHEWMHGSIPASPQALARILDLPTKEMNRLWPEIASCFRPIEGHPDRLQNPRLEEERRKQKRFHVRQQENGRKGGRPVANPWVSHVGAGGDDRERGGLPIEQPKESLAFSFSSSGEERPDKAPVSLPGERSREVLAEDAWIGNSYREVWALYPNHGAEVPGAHAFFGACRAGLIRPDATVSAAARSRTLSEFLESINAWKSSDKWRDRGGRFIPHFSNFINDGHFLNPPPAAGTQVAAAAGGQPVAGADPERLAKAGQLDAIGKRGAA